MVALPLVVLGATWVNVRRTASFPPGGVTGDPMESRLRREAARAPSDSRPCRELGRHFLAQGRAFSALWECQEALARQPGDPEARFGLAQAAANAAHFDTAAAALEHLLKQGSTLPPSLHATSARALLGAYLHTGRPEKAAAALERLHAGISDLDAARVLRAAGDFPAAETAYRRALRNERWGRDAQLGLAQLYLEWERPEAAIRLLTSATRGSPTDAEIWLWLGKAFAAGEEGRERAAWCLAKAKELRPNSAPAYYETGLLLRRKDNRAAAGEFLRALQLDPAFAEAHRALAETLRALSQPDRARREMAAYWELCEQSERVIAVLTAGGASPAADPATAASVVLAYTLLHQPQRAAELWERALREYPDDPRLLSQATLIQLMAGSREALEGVCRRWEQRDPASGDPVWLRARRAFAEARTAEAIRLFETAVEREPHRAGFCASLGIAYAAIPTPENLGRAVFWLRKAVALDPKDTATRSQLGELLARTGQPEAARRQLLLSLDLEPQQRGAINSLLQLCGTLGRSSHAALLRELVRSLETRERELQRLRRRVRARPGDPAAHAALARALARAGNLTAARNQWERAAEGETKGLYGRELRDMERLLQVLRG